MGFHASGTPIKLVNSEQHKYEMYGSLKLMLANCMHVCAELTITAGHWTFSETLHEFPASCLSDRTTCPLIHTALPHLV